MSFLKSLFGSSEVTKDVFDKDNGLLTQVGSWIGNMNYTEEEKAEAKQKVNEGVAEFVKSTLSENTVRSKTRRFIAKLWIGVELFLILLCCAVAPFDDSLAKFYWQVATSEIMFWGTTSVIAFFFGSYMLGRRK